ncbi:MAG: hypothetical protein GX130_04210 [Candidatus Hydrogenedens sp.]|nr:hypothetical protein [Candidatus Hydrogenedens sp.]
MVSSSSFASEEIGESSPELSVLVSVWGWERLKIAHRRFFTNRTLFSPADPDFNEIKTIYCV